MLRKHKILWLRIYAKVNYVLFFLSTKLEKRNLQVEDEIKEIFLTKYLQHIVTRIAWFLTFSPFEIREHLHGLQLLANERLAAAPWTRGIFRSNGACFSTSLLGHYAIYIKVGAIVGNGD